MTIDAMRILLMHDITPEQPVVEILRAAGHEIVRCSDPGHPGFPCVALDGTCPLDAGVDVAVIVHDRPSTDIAMGEVGAICATRDRIPVVLAGNHVYSPLRDRCDAVADTIDEIPAACERAAAAAADRAAEYVSFLAGAEATVTRVGHDVKVLLAAEATDGQAVLAHQAASRLFRSSRSIDVGRRPQPAGRG
jgi:hypothetical protein